jgi:ribonuclease-3
MTRDEIQKAQTLIGYQFQRPELLGSALTHASLVESRLQSNERLEFLGDSVLGVVVCEYLFRTYSDLLEGEMTKIKSAAVSRRTCARVARQLGLDELLRTGKGMSVRASLPSSVIAAVYEALIGAVFLDGGMEAAQVFIMKGLESFIHEAADSDHHSNFKSALQQAAQQIFGRTPQYVMLDEQGPDHAKCFEVAVEIGDRRFPACWGPSKKQAEQQAALEALLTLELADRDDAGNVLLRSLEEDDAVEMSDEDAEV